MNDENTQTTGLKRNPIDKFYTKSHVVDHCLALFKNKFIVNNTELIIEPSAGNGAFINGIKTLGIDNSCPQYRFYDLEPDHADIEKQDYLSFDSESIMNHYQRIHVIGNPPFGRQSSFAIKFIKKSCEFADSVSFILPKSFKKDSMHKSFPLNFHLIEEYDLPEEAFLLNGYSHNVPCVFQIWEKRDNTRNVVEKLVPIKFHFVKKDDNPDISFRRVGGTAGKIDTNIEDKSIQSHYFIKFDIPLTDNLLKKLDNIEYSSRSNTVGPRSISKPELINEFNPILQVI